MGRYKMDAYKRPVAVNLGACAFSDKIDTASKCVRTRHWQCVASSCLSIGESAPIIGHSLVLSAGDCNDGSH